MDNNFIIGQKIKTRREELGLTLKDIADQIGVASSTISRYETGRIENIKMPVIDSIADALNVNPSWLLGKSDKKNPDIDEDSLDSVYLSLARDAQNNGIDPDDIKTAIDMIKKIRKGE